MTSIIYEDCNHISLSVVVSGRFISDEICLKNDFGRSFTRYLHAKTIETIVHIGGGKLGLLIFRDNKLFLRRLDSSLTYNINTVMTLL